jgi:peptide/nickel transport system substrate-binding protein
MRLVAFAAVGMLAAAACAAPAPLAPTPSSSTPLTPPTATTAAAPAEPTVSAPPAPTPTLAASAAPAPSGPLVEASFGSLTRTLHPYPDSVSYTQAWMDAAALIWGGADGGGALLAFNWDTLDYRPAMATALPTISPDGKTFTFTLRDDLKWSDGTPISADDFQFAFDQASREDNHYVQLDLLQDITSFRTPDQRTIEITLRDARPRDLALSIINVVGPVPKHIWNGRSWTDATTNPEILHPTVVLGPYTVQEAVGEARAVFTAIDSYYVGKPRIPRVEIVANQQPSVAFDALKDGRVNWIRTLPPTLYQEARANPALDVKEWTAANATYRTLEFNLTRPFLSDKRVRQALAYAVNRSDLLNAAEQGLAVPQYGFIQPSNQRWVNQSLVPYDFDLARARQLLTDAGYRLSNNLLVGGDGQPVKLQVIFPTSSAPRATIATYLQQQYKQLGIEVQLKGLDFGAYTDQVQKSHDFDISLASYGGGSLDPDLGPKAQLQTNGPQNVTGYSNPQVDELFKQAAAELDAARRKQLYDQAQMLVNADVPSHYLYALKAVDVFSRTVQGVTPHKGDRLDANDALLNWSVAQ